MIQVYSTSACTSKAFSHNHNDIKLPFQPEEEGSSWCLFSYAENNVKQTHLIFWQDYFAIKILREEPGHMHQKEMILPSNYTV